MEKLNSMSEEWPYNLMMKFLGDEAYQKWETQIPESFFATLDYYLDTTFPARDTEIIRKYYEEHCKTQEIAKQYGLSTQSIQNILKDCRWRMAQPDTRTFLLLGMPAFLNEQKRIAYAKGYRRGFEHGSKIWSFDLVHRVAKINDYMIDLPGHDKMITKIRFHSDKARHLLMEADIHTVNQLIQTPVEELHGKVGLGKTAIEDINRYLRRTGRQRLTSKEVPNPELPDTTCWPWNLIREMMVEDSWNDYIRNLPDEAEESFELIFRIGMTQEEQHLLELRFKEKLSYRKIEQEFNAKPDFARRRIVRCFRKLRYPSRYGIIKYGVKGYMLQYLQAESERGYQEGFNKGIDIREMEYGSDCDL